MTEKEKDNLDTSLPSSEPNVHMDDTGEPYLPTLSGHETKDAAPFAQYKWDDVNRNPSLARLVAKGVTVTLRITPYAIMIWLFAPDDVRYQAKKYVRYLPWAVRYAVWWLKQNG